MTRAGRVQEDSSASHKSPLRKLNNPPTAYGAMLYTEIKMAMDENRITLVAANELMKEWYDEKP